MIGAAGTSVGGSGGSLGGAGGDPGSGGTGGGGGVTYDATVNGTPIDFSLIVAQVTPDGQRLRFWLNGARASFSLTMTFMVPMGTTKGDYSCGSVETTSLSMTYRSPNGNDYAAPSRINGAGSCSVHFTAIPATGTGRLSGTFTATLEFDQPPADLPPPWDMTPVVVTNGVFDVPAPIHFRR